MKTNQAGALLFAIITAFVLTLVASTFVVLTTNQYKIIDNEVDRIKALYYTQMGVEYAIWLLRTNFYLIDMDCTKNFQIKGTVGGVTDVILMTFSIQNQGPSGSPSQYIIRATKSY